MRILSLNINDFGGSDFFVEKIKKDYEGCWQRKWNEIQSKFDYEGLIEYLIKIDVDIFIFQEYDLNSYYAIDFTRRMKDLGYYLIKEETLYKRPSMTVMFSKMEYSLEPTPHYKTKKTARSVQVKQSEVMLIGTHIPYDDDFWDELIEYFGRYSRDYSMVLIGDYNIWLEKTNNDLSKFNSLLQIGAIDIGKSENKPTRNEKRIDFALITSSLEKNSKLNTTPCIIGKTQLESIVELNFSDHEAIILDIN